MTAYNGFLLQTTVVLDSNEYSRGELEMIYNFVILINDAILEGYKREKTLEIFENDLLLFIEIVNELIKIFERTEEYDKCSLLKNKKEQAIKINQ